MPMKNTEKTALLIAELRTTIGEMSNTVASYGNLFGTPLSFSLFQTSEFESPEDAIRLAFELWAVAFCCMLKSSICEKNEKKELSIDRWNFLQFLVYSENLIHSASIYAEGDETQQKALNVIVEETVFFETANLSTLWELTIGKLTEKNENFSTLRKRYPLYQNWLKTFPGKTIFDISKLSPQFLSARDFNCFFQITAGELSHQNRTTTGWPAYREWANKKVVVLEKLLADNRDPIQKLHLYWLLSEVTAPTPIFNPGKNPDLILGSSSKSNDYKEKLLSLLKEKELQIKLKLTNNERNAEKILEKLSYYFERKQESRKFFLALPQNLREEFSKMSGLLVSNYTQLSNSVMAIKALLGKSIFFVFYLKLRNFSENFIKNPGDATPLPVLDAWGYRIDRMVEQNACFVQNALLSVNLFLLLEKEHALIPAFFNHAVHAMITGQNQALRTVALNNIYFDQMAIAYNRIPPSEKTDIFLKIYSAEKLKEETFEEITNKIYCTIQTLRVSTIYYDLTKFIDLIVNTLMKAQKIFPVGAPILFKLGTFSACLQFFLDHAFDTYTTEAEKDIRIEYNYFTSVSMTQPSISVTQGIHNAILDDASYAKKIQPFIKDTVFLNCIWQTVFIYQKAQLICAIKNSEAPKGIAVSFFCDNIFRLIKRCPIPKIEETIKLSLLWGDALNFLESFVRDNIPMPKNSILVRIHMRKMFVLLRLYKENFSQKEEEQSKLETLIDLIHKEIDISGTEKQIEKNKISQFKERELEFFSEFAQLNPSVLEGKETLDLLKDHFEKLLCFFSKKLDWNFYLKEKTMLDYWIFSVGVKIFSTLSNVKSNRTILKKYSSRYQRTLEAMTALLKTEFFQKITSDLPMLVMFSKEIFSDLREDKKARTAFFNGLKGIVDLLSKEVEELTWMFETLLADFYAQIEDNHHNLLHREKAMSVFSSLSATTGSENTIPDLYHSLKPIMQGMVPFLQTIEKTSQFSLENFYTQDRWESVIKLFYSSDLKRDLLFLEKLAEIEKHFKCYWKFILLTFDLFKDFFFGEVQHRFLNFSKVVSYVSMMNFFHFYQLTGVCNNQLFVSAKNSINFNNFIRQFFSETAVSHTLLASEKFCLFVDVQNLKKPDILPKEIDAYLCAYSNTEITGPYTIFLARWEMLLSIIKKLRAVIENGFQEKDFYKFFKVSSLFLNLFELVYDKQILPISEEHKKLYKEILNLNWSAFLPKMLSKHREDDLFVKSAILCFLRTAEEIKPLATYTHKELFIEFFHPFCDFVFEIYQFNIVGVEKKIELAIANFLDKSFTFFNHVQGLEKKNLKLLIKSLDKLTPLLSMMQKKNKQWCALAEKKMALVSMLRESMTPKPSAAQQPNNTFFKAAAPVPIAATPLVYVLPVSSVIYVSWLIPLLLLPPPSSAPVSLTSSPFFYGFFTESQIETPSAAGMPVQTTNIVAAQENGTPASNVLFRPGKI